MSNKLADQLGWSITTKDYLNDLQTELKYVANQYNTSKDNLAQAGYIAEYMPIIEHMNEEFDTQIDALISYISSEHLSYIEEQTATIRNQISAIIN